MSDGFSAPLSLGYEPLCQARASQEHVDHFGSVDFLLAQTLS